MTAFRVTSVLLAAAALAAPAAVRPGVYPFVCTFPGHVQAGMRGTLVVK
jgi:uncharacterized cupredoxin-like copper-binding protein